LRGFGVLPKIAGQRFFFLASQLGFFAG